MPSRADREVAERRPAPRRLRSPTPCRPASRVVGARPRTRDPRVPSAPITAKPRRRPVLAGEDRGHAARAARRARAPGRRPAGRPVPRSGRCRSATFQPPSATHADRRPRPRRASRAGDRRRARSAPRGRRALRRAASTGAARGAGARRPVAADAPARRRVAPLAQVRLGGGEQPRLERGAAARRARPSRAARSPPPRARAARRARRRSPRGARGPRPSRRRRARRATNSGARSRTSSQVEAVRVRHGGPSRLGASSGHGRPSSRRSATSARRTRLLTVPSGTPVRSAISVWDRPPK